jgi:HK97 family phage prohead protease
MLYKDDAVPPAPGAALRETTLHKTVFIPLRFNKNAVAGQKPHGVITGYASVFNIKDRQGDIVPRGAFAATLIEHKSAHRLPPMLWMHDPRRPCGSWLMMAEDAIGLRVRGQLALGTQLGREALALVKQGAVTGLSIGYRIRHSRFDTAQQARILQSVELDEVSLVTLPANPAAQVSAVKYIAGHNNTLLEKYNPRQPRVPRGNADGGQWTDDMAFGGDGVPHRPANRKPPLTNQELALARRDAITPVYPLEVLAPALRANRAARQIIALLRAGRRTSRLAGRGNTEKRNSLIDGILYDPHAIMRMELRRIPPSVVKNTIKFGTSQPSYKGRTLYYDKINNVTVVVGEKPPRVLMVRKGKP